ncbi:MAG: cytochrome c [Rubrivivax sp.]
MKHPLLALTAAAACLLTALPAAAQFQKSQDAIQYRQSLMTLQNFHLGRLFAMAQGKVPYDAKRAADDAAIVAAINPSTLVGFGSGTDKGGSNRARPEIWTNAADFKAKAEQAATAVAALNQAAKVGTVDALKEAVGPVGQACKACHDDYRAEKYSN